MYGRLAVSTFLVLAMGGAGHAWADQTLVMHHAFEGVDDFTDSVTGVSDEPYGDANVIWDDDRGSYVLSLDGDGDYVGCGDKWTGLVESAITVAAWIRTDSLGSYDTVVALGYAWRLCGGNTGNLRFQCMDTTPSGSMATGSTSVNDGQWHHLA